MSGLNKNTTYLLLCILYVVLIFHNSHIQPLLADEPIRALGALEMEISGKAIPTINGEVYLNKPPLYNWILLGFFKLTGSHSEFVVRLPALLSLLLFGWLIFYFTKKLTDSTDIAFWTAFATLSSGNILFYSSMLGHIDALYSAVVYTQIILLYIHADQKKWWSFFMVSFALTFIGFLLKGLPSLVFQAISVTALLLLSGQIKKLISKEGLWSALVFLLLMSAYFLFYSGYVNLADYIGNLWQESSKRTVIDKSILDSIKHLFLFPGQYFIDTLVYSLLIFRLMRKSDRQIIQKDPLLRAILVLFIANILIYWLSPDNRARYIFMLYPLLFIVLFRLHFLNRERVIEQVYSVLIYLFPLIISGAYFYFSKETSGLEIPFIGVVLLCGAMAYGYYKNSKLLLVNLALIVLCSRFLFNLTVIPTRAVNMPAVREKQEALDIAGIAGKDSMALYYSNIHLNMAWYISAERMMVLPIKDEDDRFSTSEFYIIPEDVISDKVESESYYTFVRGFENKTFKLLKYKQLPSDRKKHVKKNITGHSRPQ